MRRRACVKKKKTAGQVRLETLIRDAITERRSMEEILAELEFVEDPGAIAAVRESMSDASANNHIEMTSILDDGRDSKERRLTPEFVERFFVDGLRHLVGRLMAADDRDWRLDFVPADIRREVRAAKTGEFGEGGRIITFNKERLRRDPPAEFAAPGTRSSTLFSLASWTEGGPSFREAPSSSTGRRPSRTPSGCWKRRR